VKALSSTKPYVWQPVTHDKWISCVVRTSISMESFISSLWFFTQYRLLQISVGSYRHCRTV